MGKNKETKQVDQSSFIPSDNSKSSKTNFLNVLKNIFRDNFSRYEFNTSGKMYELNQVQYKDLITKMSCIKYMAECILNLRAIKSGKVVSIVLWKNYQVSLTLNGEFRFLIKTVGLEMLRIIPKIEKSQQKELKIGTFNIIYYFLDALSNPDRIENIELRNHLKGYLKVDFQTLLFGPKAYSYVTGIQEFNQFCFCLTLLGINSKTLFNLFDILYYCLLFGCQGKETQLNLLQKSFIDKISVEPKQQAKMPWQTKNRVNGAIILMYQLFCDTIFKHLQQFDEKYISVVSIIEKPDFIGNEGTKCYDLSFVDFDSNYVYLALEKKENNEIISKFENLFGKNRPWEKADIHKVYILQYQEFGYPRNTLYVKLPWYDGELNYNLEDCNLNFFSLNSEIQLKLKNSQNTILQNLRLVNDCDTETLMFVVFQKVQKFRDMIHVETIPETIKQFELQNLKNTNVQGQLSTQQKNSMPETLHCLNSFRSEVFLSSFINSKGSYKCLNASLEFQVINNRIDSHTHTQVQLKRSIKDYNQNVQVYEIQFKTESEIIENNSGRLDQDDEIE